MIGKCQILVAVCFIADLMMCVSANAQDIEYDRKKIQLVMLEKAKDVVITASNPIIVAAVEAQNAIKLSKEEIITRDKKWISSADNVPFKISLQENPSGALLKSIVVRNRAIYSEAFLTDSQGANVSAYPATSDYWQGDEAKFVIAFNQGRGQILITPVEFDQSAHTYAAQVAAPVVNSKGETIGVLFVGIKLSYAQVR